MKNYEHMQARMLWLTVSNDKLTLAKHYDGLDNVNVTFRMSVGSIYNKALLQKKRHRYESTYF